MTAKSRDGASRSRQDGPDTVPVALDGQSVTKLYSICNHRYRLRNIRLLNVLVQDRCWQMQQVELANNESHQD